MGTKKTNKPSHTPSHTPSHELQSSKHLRNQRTINMNSMVMSTRKAVVARPTQSRKVASKATRRPVMMAGMQVLKPEKKYECLSYLPPLSSLREQVLDHVEAPHVRM